MKRGATTKKVSSVGVLVGGIADVGSTTVCSIPLVLYVMAKSGVFQTPGDHRGVDLEAIIHASTILYGLQLSIGLGGSVFGGYIAAWLAKHDELLNGLLSSWLCTLGGIYSLSGTHRSVSLVEGAILLMLSPVFSSFGGYLRQKQKSSAGLRPAP